ncbi:Tol-Pal system beta propeller repeat protein TolB [uncultured Endozoicomonas sp.]|uniref:Tol-Pal system beta propeller repeat protein TolB n=1 Tax=uncultured Endozoicomonas sp. TaxID=432652 RepID=UPI002625A96A|nr:Tol-Pal system beta propeller repeat protein TolB [uncultured Endozoicomonas sp.]
MRELLKSCLVIYSLLFGMLAHGELLIEVTSGNDQAVSIAVSPFSWQGDQILPEDPAGIVDNDLNLSGVFKAMPRTSMLSFPVNEAEVYYRDWKVLGANYLVTGQVSQTGPVFTLNYQLYDVIRGKRIDQGGFSGTVSQLREMSHRVSDSVYENITGLTGDFSTRILYVTAQRHSVERTDYQLNYADADGKRTRKVFSSREPILSPSWSPDGTRVTYVSFEQGRPAIYMQELATGKRKKLTNFKGLNNSPVWAPDGKSIAMVLSKDGNPDVYILDLATNKFSNVTSHYGIDTEPDWMPDGKSFIFTSNRGGGPQVYQQAVSRRSNGKFVAEGKPKRLTFEGKFNARAKVFPDGKSIALVHKGQGAAAFNIAILDLDTGRLRPLTSSKLEDSPSIAPGGRRLIYSVQGGEHGELGIVSADGRVKQRLPSAYGDVREPAWGPATSLK